MVTNTIVVVEDILLICNIGVACKALVAFICIFVSIVVVDSYFYIVFSVTFRNDNLP